MPKFLARYYLWWSGSTLPAFPLPDPAFLCWSIFLTYMWKYRWRCFALPVSAFFHRSDIAPLPPVHCVPGDRLSSKWLPSAADCTVPVLLCWPSCGAFLVFCLLLYQRLYAPDGTPWRSSFLPGFCTWWRYKGTRISEPRGGAPAHSQTTGLSSHWSRFWPLLERSFQSRKILCIFPSAVYRGWTFARNCLCFCPCFYWFHHG